MGKQHKNDKKTASIINSNACIYTNTTKSIDGKRQHKRKCMYYDADTEYCNNTRCSKVVCITAHNCTGYKRVKDNIKKKDTLSPYDENYIQLPYKAGIHEPDNRFISMSRNIGTPMHGEYLKSDGIRRHKTRCIHYIKNRKMCEWFGGKMQW